MAFKRQPPKKARETKEKAGSEVCDNHNDCQPNNQPSKMDIAMQKQIVFILTSLNNLTNSVSRLKRQFIVIAIIYGVLFIGLLLVALLRGL